MQITWHGQSCFSFLTTQGKNNQLNIVIDPFDESLGLRIPKLEADVLLITHQHEDHNNGKAVSGNPFVIENPGEYEVKNVFVQGIEAYHDSSQGKERGDSAIYTIEAEEMKLCHLGDLGQKELTAEQLEQIGDIDILMIPVGGVYTIDAPSAAKIISQIEPKIVIPMHYQIPKLKLKLEGLDRFLKTMGVKSEEVLSKLNIKKKDLSEEGMKVIVLSC